MNINYKYIFVIILILIFYYCERKKQNIIYKDFDFYFEQYEAFGKTDIAKEFAVKRRQYFFNIIDKEKNRSYIYGQIGLTYSVVNDFNMAIKYYNKSLYHSNNSNFIWLPYKELGFAYYMKKEYTNAINYYKKQININSFDGTSFYFIAACYYHLGDYDNSNKYLKEYSNYKIKEPINYTDPQKEKFWSQTKIIKTYADKLQKLLKKKLMPN